MKDKLSLSWTERGIIIAIIIAVSLFIGCVVMDGQPLVTNLPPLTLKTISIIRPCDECGTYIRADISSELVTNWVKDYENPDGVGAVDANGKLIRWMQEWHETGTIYSNTIAQIYWNGQKQKAILEIKQIGTAERTVTQ